MNKYIKEITALINKIAYMHTQGTVFRDFIEMAAISISNSVARNYFNEREKRYLELIRKYDTDRQKLFFEAFGYLVEALEYEAQAGTPSDILGLLFMNMGLGDKGQFFTPQHVCNMMGKMSLSEHDKTIAEKGRISILEPCCGAGAMVLGFAQAMKDSGYDYTQQMTAVAVDTDIRCVHMCYIQLALYGIPAVVIHGDSLSLKEWSHWYTPVYILQGQPLKEQYIIDETNKSAADEAPTQLSLFEKEANALCSEEANI